VSFSLSALNLYLPSRGLMWVHSPSRSALDVSLQTTHSPARIFLIIAEYAFSFSPIFPTETNSFSPTFIAIVISRSDSLTSLRLNLAPSSRNGDHGTGLRVGNGRFECGFGEWRLKHGLIG